MEFLLSLLMSLFSFGGSADGYNPHAPIESPYAYEKNAQNGIKNNSEGLIIIFEDTHFRPTIER